MKNLTIILLVVLLSCPVMAQDETLFSGEIESGWYGGLTYKIGQINDETGFFNAPANVKRFINDVTHSTVGLTLDIIHAHLNRLVQESQEGPVIRYPRRWNRTPSGSPMFPHSF